jgi:mannose-6-phosphate isomerase-like protein (cupin superfamily)
MRIVRSRTLVEQVRSNGRRVLPLADLEIPRDSGRVAVLLARHHAHFTEDVHVHRFMWEIFYFLDDAEYWIAGDRYHVAAGDLVVIEPGEPHGALPVDHPVEILVQQIPKVDGDKHPWPNSSPAS